MTVDFPHSGHSVRAEAIVRRFARGAQDIEFDRVMSVHEVPPRQAVTKRYSPCSEGVQQFQAPSEDERPQDLE